MQLSEVLGCWSIPKVHQNVKFGNSITMDGELFSELKVFNPTNMRSQVLLVTKPNLLQNFC